MKKLYLSFILIAAFGMVSAQSCPGGSTPSGGGSSSLSSGGGASFQQSTGSVLQGISYELNANQYLSAVSTYDGIEGSPYFTKQERGSTLVMNDGSEISDVKIKYDLYAGEIIAFDEKGNKVVLDTRYYKEIIVDNEGEELRLKKVNPKKPKQFYEVLYESGNVVFFKEEDARLRKGENLGIINSASKFTQHKKYFVKGLDGAVAKVNLKKRDVFNHFPEIEAVAFREYIKSTKIKLSKEKDYKKLFAAMDDD